MTGAALPSGRRAGRLQDQADSGPDDDSGEGGVSRDKAHRRILFKYKSEFYINYYAVVAGIVFMLFLFVHEKIDTVIDLTSYGDWAIAIAAALAGAVALAAPLIPGMGEWLRRASAVKRAGLIIFVIMPAAFLLLVMIARTVNFNWVYLGIRFMFLVYATLLPAVLYYLFIATRRESLLNAYLSNLDRLGLLGRRRKDSAGEFASDVSAKQERDFELEASRRRRVTSYLERFEASYGRLPEQYVNDFLESTDPGIDHLGQVKFPNLRGWATPFTIQTILPVLTATFLIALGWLVVLPMNKVLILLMYKTNNESYQWASAILPDLSLVNFAFLGAYFFSLQMIFRRFVRRDLGPNAYIAVVLRIVLAVIGAWIAIHALRFLQPDLSKDAQFIIAFCIGAFPLIIWQLIVGVAKRLPGVRMALPSLKTDLPLSDLDGLSVWHEARLEEEDIENIPNMAAADIVDLILSTKFSPNRIIDWIDQAILYTAIGAVNEPTRKAFRELLRSYGIRTASALVDLLPNSLQKSGGGEKAGLASPFPQADQGRIATLAGAIRTNPNLLLVQTWRGQ